MQHHAVELRIDQDFGAARAGDAAAYTRLVSATQNVVTSVALAITRDISASEDIAQETYLSAWERLGKLRDARSFLPWLREIARNRAIDHLRRQRLHEQATNTLEGLLHTLSETRDDPAIRWDRDQDAQLLTLALAEVPDDCREVLLLYYREGQSTRQVAELLGLHESAVRKRVQRARDSVRQEVMRLLGNAAQRSAPGLGLAMAVQASLALRPEIASAAIAGTGGVKAALKFGLGALGGLGASILVVLGGIFVELRPAFRRTLEPAQRRALWHNALVYALVMVSYMIVLWSAIRMGWSPERILAVGVGYALVIVLLALRRRALLGRQRCAWEPRDSDPR
jgi:RNA polymerase sigma factor (sigma-70 family)